MRDSLLRLRVPMTVLLLVVSGFQTLLRLVWVGVTAGDDGFVRSVAGQYDYLSSWMITLAITLAVGLCRLVAPHLPAARKLALAAVLLVGAQVALSTLFSLTTLVLDENGGGFAVFRLLTGFAELAVMIGLLIVLFRLVGQPESRPALSLHSAGQTGISQPTLSAPTSGSQISTGWQPQPNAGAVWGSAHQAASGISASGWGGAPDQSGGWTPQGSAPPDQNQANQNHPALQNEGPGPNQGAGQNQGVGQNQGTHHQGAGEEQQHTRIVDPRQWGGDAGSGHPPGQGRP